MRLDTAFKVACALGILSNTALGFVTPLPSRTIKIGVNSGWDNDDFLNTLVGSSASSSSSSSEGDDGEGDEEGQGGSRFKEMMQQAQSRTSQTPPVAAPPQYEPYVEPPPPPPQEAVAPGGLENLSVEDQARLFREFIAKQQQPQAAAEVPPPPAKQMRGGLDAQGRKIGRNRDADSIANSSDVYFAQLKRDSSIRTQARMRGDQDKAEQVFGDPSIKEIEEQLRKNPYLTEQEARSRSFIEGTSQEESLVVVPEKDKTDKPETYTGVSFRKKLKEVKRKKAGGFGEAAPPPKAEAPKAVAVAPAAPKPKEEPVAAAPVAPMPKKEPVAPVVETPPEPVAAAAVPEMETPKPVAAAPQGETDEEMRRDLRTLMGLILKHRGGPGFGSGRLKEAEAKRMQSLLAEVSDTLRAEAGMEPAAKAPVAAPEPVTKAAVEPEPAPVTPEPVVTPPPVVAHEPPVAATPAAPSVAYEDALGATIACVEGAIAAYKQTPEALREGAMVTLRAALMAAVNTCNKVIAENEVANKQAYEAKVGNAATPAAVSMDFPDEFNVLPEPVDEPPVAVIEPEVEAPVVPQVGPNTELLQKLYDELQAAKGGENLGLKGNLTPEEARSLADKLVVMRSVLMDELDNGLAETERTPVKIAPTSIMSPEEAVKAHAKTGTSKYEQKLAKAKLEKQQKKHKWWEELKK